MTYFTAGRRPKLPPIGDPAVQDQSHASQCRAYLSWWFRYRTTKRAELERTWNRARLYDAAKQWLQPYRKAGTDRLWYNWEPLRLTGKADMFPRPVRNHFSPALQDEVSRLVGVGRRPYIRLDDPEKEMGAMLSKQVLLDRVEKTDWDRQQRIGCYHAAAFGQWIQESNLEYTKTNCVKAAPPNAMRCPTDGCGFMLTSSEVTEEQARDLPPGVSHREENPNASFDKGLGPYLHMVDNCPLCSEPLRQWEDIPRDLWSNGGQDSLGRPMSVKQSLADDVSGPVSPYDFWPDNQGVGYESADKMEAFGMRRPRSVDWVKNHYENSVGIMPNADVEAFAHHPVLVSYGMGHFVASTDGIWDSWGMLDEFYQKPNADFPRGRAIVMWGTRLLVDDEYYLPNTDIERVNIQVAQWELRENEIWGKSLSEDLFSVQDNINSTLSQAMNIRQKYTDPKILLHQGMDLEFRGGARSNYSSDVWTINNTGVPPEIAAQYPKFFGNQGVPSEIFQEMDREIQFVQTASGARSAEIGNVSGVELNYSALLFAAQKSAERRKPRVQGIRNLNRMSWTHKLRMIAAFWREERLIHYRNDSNQWAVRQVRGFELKGQTDVTLEDEALVDSAIALRASIEQGMKYQTIRTSANGGSYGADQKINRAIGIPEDLNSDRNQQEDGAGIEWLAWLDDDIEPAIDREHEDHLIHYRRHNIDFEGRKGKELQKALLLEHGVQWGRDVLIPTWEWERLLIDLYQMREGIRESQKMPPDKMMEAGVPPEKIMSLQQQVENLKLNLIGFPGQLELQIYNVWKRLLLATGNTKLLIPQSVSLIWPLHRLVRFKAHLLGHTMIALQRPYIQQAQGPPPPGGAGLGGVNPIQMQALQQGAGGQVPGAGAGGEAAA